MVLDTALDINDEMDEPNGDFISSVRERLKAVSQLQSLPAAQIGKLAGVGTSTVAAFLNATYNGDNQRTAAKIQIWLDQRERQGRTSLAMPKAVPFTLTPSAKAMIGALEYAQSLADFSVIVGGPGVGKTQTIEQYSRTNANVWLVTADPASARLAGILDYLCETIGVAETMMKRRSRAIAARVRGSQGLIIVDEAQHLNVEAFEQLRSIHDKSGVGMAVAGSHDVWTRLDGGGRKSQFAQLFGRVGIRVNVPKPTMGDIDALLDAADVTDKKQRGMLKAIASKPGALRQMMKTLRLARMVALGADEDMTADHIGHAWNRLSGSPEAA
jgi:DNA transposition AAA+ family ATPase